MSNHSNQRCQMNVVKQEVQNWIKTQPFISHFAATDMMCFSLGVFAQTESLGCFHSPCLKALIIKLLAPASWQHIMPCASVDPFLLWLTWRFSGTPFTLLFPLLKLWDLYRMCPSGNTIYSGLTPLLTFLYWIHLHIRCLWAWTENTFTV